MVLPVPSPPTFTVGEILTAALMNANVRDAVNFLANPPLVVCYQSTGQSVPNNAFTAITMDTNQVDTYSGHSTVTNPSRYTAQVAGWYLALGTVGFAANATGVRDLEFTVSGAAVAYSQARRSVVAAALEYMQIVGLVQLAVGQYLELQAFQNTGASMTLAGGGISSLQALWVHA